MLVLSRKSRESVVVGGADGFQHVLRITVLEISGGKVKLGFDVDAGIPVHREEVWQRIRAHGPSDSPGNSQEIIDPRSARVSDPAETADRRSPAISETFGRPGGSVGDRPQRCG